jgi:deoxycytidylate deaminase/dephospho-CoA kinase
MQEIFKNLRDDFILIGLTGAIASGSTTVSKHLAKKFETFEITNTLDCELNAKTDDIEKRRIQRVKEFYSQNPWNSFYHLKVSNILFAIIFATKDVSENKDLKLNQWYKDSDHSDAITLSKQLISAIENYNEQDESFEIKTLLQNIDELIAKKVTKSDISYTKVFQEVGKNLRDYGTIDKSLKSVLRYDDIPNVFFIAETLRRVGKLLYNLADEKYIIIDALRNTYEIQYFKNRYANFYLFSVLADEETRRKRTQIQFGLKEGDYDKIKSFEYEDKEASSQNINSCIGLGDVFLNNNANCTDKYLHYQLFKYIALVRKPALFTPNDDERNMQVALTARYNSGCISRQVGACVTGADGYVRGIGWNDVQEGNTPCLYRTLDELLQPNENEAYSEYEKSKEFQAYVKKQDLNTKVPFCFKDIENKKHIENKLAKFEFAVQTQKELSKLFKNPTRERALHAEENAFLQLAKTGGQSVVGGTLYTTDSPCQLCAKKAMQLKIKRIVYIDAYPDISTTHTLKSGIKEEYPDFDMFEGVTGNAYFRLFRPIVGIKEELSRYKC